MIRCIVVAAPYSIVRVGLVLVANLDMVDLDNLLLHNMTPFQNRIE